MSNEATAADWNAVKPALYEAAKGHWFELDALFNERDALLAEVGRLRTMVEHNARESHAALHVGGIAGGPSFEDCKERLCVEARAALSPKKAGE